MTDTGGPIGHALTVLETVARLGEPTLTEVTRACGRPKSSVHRILATLVATGAVERVEDTYLLGARIRALAVPPPPPVAELPRRLRPYLVELYEETGLVATLAERRGDFVAYLDPVFDHANSRVATQAEGLLPLYCTAAGRILLAYATAESLTSYLDHTELAPRTRHTVTSPERLRAELADVRRRGLAIAREEYVLGVVGMAVPIRHVGHGVVAALCVGGAARRGDWNHAARVLHRIGLAVAVVRPG